MSKINLVYYNDEIRCYRDGQVERYFKRKGWKIIKNNNNQSDGYNFIKINKKLILRHRIIAYCFVGLDDIIGNKKGKFIIDHIDGNKLNNCVKNLRITNQSGNNQNRKNVKGYTFIKRMNKYEARITVNGKAIILGYFDTKEEARNAYLEGKKIYHTAID